MAAAFKLHFGLTEDLSIVPVAATTQEPFTGTAFLQRQNIEEIVYSPRLIAEADLPKSMLAVPDTRGNRAVSH